MSLAQKNERRESFFDAVRAEAVSVVYSNWSLLREPIGTRRAADLTIQKIVRKNSAGEWHWREIPVQITTVRRIEEAAKRERYWPENPPLRCLGMRRYQGRRESQYMPFEAEFP